MDFNEYSIIFEVTCLRLENVKTGNL